MAITEFKILDDATGTPGYGTLLSNEVWNFKLAADTDTTVTVPTGARRCIVSADDYFFVAASIITLPSTGTPTKQSGEQNKGVIDLTDGTATLHFRSRNQLDISVSFYR